MSPDPERPFCGAELLPHATFPDGSPAPIVCTREPHGADEWHGNEETGTIWAWQNAGDQS